MFLFWCIFSALFQDWESYIQTEFAETKSFRSPSFVAASEGIHFVDFFGPCQEDQPFEEPPQCRTSLQPSIREVHHPINCSHGESTAEIQNILAMCTMLENCKGRGQRMPQVQGPLVRCGRPYLCAQASAAQGTTNDACTATLDLEYVESGATCNHQSQESKTKIYVKKGQRSKEERLGLELRGTSVCLSDRESLCSSIGPNIALSDDIQFIVQNRWFHEHTLASTSAISCACNRICSALQAEGLSTELNQGRTRPGPRDLGGSQVLLSRLGNGSSQDTRTDRESRQSCPSDLGRRYKHSNRKTQKIEKDSEQYPRSQGKTQTILAFSSREERHGMARDAHSLHKATGPFQWSDWQNQGRHESCESNHSSHESESRYGVEPRCQGRGSQRVLGSCQRQARSRDERTSAKPLAAVHRSHHRGGCDRGRRRDGRTQKEAWKISRTNGWPWWGRWYLVIVGSVFPCPRNEIRVPSCFKHVHFETAESYNGEERYPLDRPICAVLNCPPIDVRGSIHSILLDEDCVHLFDAQRDAWCLQAECFFDRSEDVLHEFEYERCTAHSVKDVTRNPSSLSSLPEKAIHDNAQDDLEEIAQRLQITFSAAVGATQNLWTLGPHHDTADHDQIDQTQLNDPRAPSQRGSRALAHDMLANSESFVDSLGAFLRQRDAQQGPIVVASWYVDQLRLPQQDIRRDIELSHDPSTWMEDLTRAWSDWILPGIPISAHLALPQPTTDGNADVLHVLLLQNERDGLCSILLQTHVFDRDYKMNMLIAVTVARIGGYEMLFHIVCYLYLTSSAR